MPLALDKIHIYARHRDTLTGEVSQRLTDFNPVLRIRQAGEPPIYIQRGAAYYENGTPVLELPEWAGAMLEHTARKTLEDVGWVKPAALPAAQTLDEQIATMTPAERYALLTRLQRETPVEEAGLDISQLDADDYPEDAPEEESVSLLPPLPGTEPSTENMWTCDECGETMSTRKKGFHIGKHRQEALRRMTQEG